MKYVIVAILAALLGAGLEFERGNLEIRLAHKEIGLAYGCGALAATRGAVKQLDPTKEFVEERPWCAEYRKQWEHD
jgi:hypothetical protein